MTDTLIADGDGIYDPAAYSDRLVLGLKGTISEAELHLLKGGLIAGMRHKAAKGELRVALPAGLEYDQDGRPAVCADEAVREAIATVFRRFAELGSARQVMLSLLADGLELPRRRAGGRVVWAPASYGAVIGVLANPCYAGAFAFGRTRKAGRAGVQGRPVRPPAGADAAVGGADLRPPSRLYLLGGLPGQPGAAARELRGPARPGRRRGAGGPRAAAGHRALRALWPHDADRLSGQPPQAPAALLLRGRGHLLRPPGLLPGRGRPADRAGRGRRGARRAEPAALAATAQALADAGAARAERLRAFELAAERARYEAGRARRQYDACEPENRLVARSLEAAWEDRLAAVTRAEAALATEQARQPSPLSAEETGWLSRAGADVRAIFESPTTTPRERKQLIRALLSEVTLTVDRQARTAALTLSWEGGAITQQTVALPRLGAPWRTTQASTVDLIRRLAEHYNDATIASVLARQHRRTGTGLTFTKTRVAEVRRNHHIPPPPDRRTGLS